MTCLFLQSVFLYLFQPGLLMCSYSSGGKKRLTEISSFSPASGFLIKTCALYSTKYETCLEKCFSPHVCLGPCSPSSPCW